MNHKRNGLGLGILLALLVSVLAACSPAAPAAGSSGAVDLVQQYYAALNAGDVDRAMTYVAGDAVFANPTGTFEGAAEIRASLEGGVKDGLTFELSNFRDNAGRVVYDYRVMQGKALLDSGKDGLTIVKNGKIVFDGTERTESAQ